MSRAREDEKYGLKLKQEFNSQLAGFKTHLAMWFTILSEWNTVSDELECSSAVSVPTLRCTIQLFNLNLMLVGPYLALALFECH